MGHGRRRPIGPESSCQCSYCDWLRVVIAVATTIEADKGKEARVMQRYEMKRARVAQFCSVLALTVPTMLNVDTARAEQPPPPCHPNPNAAADELAVRGRGDIANVPEELQDRLAQLANRPHTYLPLQVFNEADEPSQLFQYYLLDTTGFEPTSSRLSCPVLMTTYS